MRISQKATAYSDTNNTQSPRFGLKLPRPIQKLATHDKAEAKTYRREERTHVWTRPLLGLTITSTVAIAHAVALAGVTTLTAPVLAGGAAITGAIYLKNKRQARKASNTEITRKQPDIFKPAPKPPAEH